MTSRLRVGSPKSRDQRRHQDQPWRKWYRTKRWRALRQHVFARDGWVCQQTGVMLVGAHPEPNSPVADHIIPHRGDEALFWDPKNIQTVSKEWHDSEKQRQEIRDRNLGCV